MTETDNVRAEGERMDHIARLTDPATFRHLEDAIKVSEGWRCAEVGAGTGSVARWLSNRVGHYGLVEAIDIETAHLERLNAPNLRVIKQDITTCPLEVGAYDLVHAKILLMHLPERERVLQELANALKPGGYLLVEEADVRSIQRVEPPAPTLTRAAAALETFFYMMGADPAYAMSLQPAVRDTGLQVMGTDCQLTAVQAGTTAMLSVSLSLAKLAPMIVKAGLMSDAEVQQAFALMEQPGPTVLYTPTIVSVWAQQLRG
ncbi:ubiquinone/menaquinone biosynthesis C-methylase UbiE [Naumannella cuiyingiana]|uniref:Ubiquinone/menaquinone biosynthesis C-methylase UbiE n=1 Tax=Naumannella cuiyingiana TaxID=1347891 RepID=A0A7Z0D7W7_9ACTN|nr:class I SAM-dependent methyltransferase [Naumannella cuiyingiana]NYI70517.1 ubiquinone/menaquinone biosynthesis C-methylase UbiE [Naumannella cuiyingiana]